MLQTLNGTCTRNNLARRASAVLSASSAVLNKSLTATSK